jgi:hypothetical protein
MPVMNVEAVPCSAAGAPKVIADEDDFPVASKVIPRMPAGVVTPRAEARDRRNPFAAGAEERLLPENVFPVGPQDAFGIIGKGCG